jgi:hypothetical protein
MKQFLLVIITYLSVQSFAMGAGNLAPELGGFSSTGIRFLTCNCTSRGEGFSMMWVLSATYVNTKSGSLERTELMSGGYDQTVCESALSQNMSIGLCPMQAKLKTLKTCQVYFNRYSDEAYHVVNPNSALDYYGVLLIEEEEISHREIKRNEIGIFKTMEEANELLEKSVRSGSCSY